MNLTTPRTLLLKLPLPPRALSPNRTRGHWSTHPAAARAYRARCGYAAGSQSERPAFARARISYRFVYCKAMHRDPRCFKGRTWVHHRLCQCDYHPADLDNALATTKQLQDSLVDVGILQADDARHLALGGVEIAHCPKGCTCEGAVMVTVEEVLG